MNVVKYAPGRKPRLLPGSGISRSKWESSPSLRTGSASAARPLREADCPGSDTCGTARLLPKDVVRREEAGARKFFR